MKSTNPVITAFIVFCLIFSACGGGADTEENSTNPSTENTQNGGDNIHRGKTMHDKLVGKWQSEKEPEFVLVITYDSYKETRNDNVEFEATYTLHHTCDTDRTQESSPYGNSMWLDIDAENRCNLITSLEDGRMVFFRYTGQLDNFYKLD